MGSSWRSWFWNSILLAVMALFTGILAAVAVDEAGRRDWLVALGFGVAALWTGAAMARSFFVGVYARPGGVVVRGLWLTKTIPWSEITEITAGRPTSGAAGTLGATTAVMMRRRPGTAEPRAVVLNVVGGYGLSRARPTPADRAIAGLTAHLQNWRDQDIRKR